MNRLLAAAAPVPGENEDVDLWWLGAIIYMSGSILINLGSNIIRFSHEKLKLYDTPPPIYKRYWWLLGFSIFGIGNVFNFIGFMFAAQSLLVALGSIQFVSNLFFARLVNKEPITRRSLLATSIIIIGNVIIVFFGNKTSETYDLDELWELFIRPPFLAYISTLILCIIVLQMLYLLIKFKYIRKVETPHSLVLKINLQRFMPFAYAATSTMTGTFSVTIGKALSGLVLLSIEPEGVGQLKSIYPWLLLTIFIGITVFWLYRMNIALKTYDAMFIIPVLQALWLLFAVLGGGIFYQEFKDMGLLDSCLFGCGIAVLLCGVAIFSPREPEKDFEVMSDENDVNKEI